jgi:hypothetical protein
MHLVVHEALMWCQPPICAIHAQFQHCGSCQNKAPSKTGWKWVLKSMEVLADVAITTSVFAYYFTSIKGKRKATPTSDAGDAHCKKVCNDLDENYNTKRIKCSAARIDVCR